MIEDKYFPNIYNHFICFIKAYYNDKSALIKYKFILTEIFRNSDLLAETINKIFNKFINRFIKPIFYNTNQKSNFYEIKGHTFDCSKNKSSLFDFLFWLIFIIKEKNNNNKVHSSQISDKFKTSYQKMLNEFFANKQNILEPIVNRYFYESYLSVIKDKHQFKKLKDLLENVPNFLIFFFNYANSVNQYMFNENWIYEMNKLNQILKDIDSSKLKLTSNNLKKNYSLNELKTKGEYYIKNNLIKEYDLIDERTIIYIVNYISDNLFNYISITFKQDKLIDFFKYIFNVFVGYMILIINEYQLKKIMHQFENAYNIKLNDSISNISRQIDSSKDPLNKLIYRFFNVDINDSNLNITIQNHLLLRNNEYQISNSIDWFKEFDNQTNVYIQKYKDKIIELIKDFLNKYYKDNVNVDNVNYLYENLESIFYHFGNIIKRAICIIIDNLDYFSQFEDKLDNFWYFVIYLYEMNGESADESYNIEKSNIDKKSIIKDCYNIQALNKVINDNFTNNFKEVDFSQIDLICFVDNNLLSNQSRFNFSNKERLGDLLYKIIIYDLIINAQIKDLTSYDDYFAAKFQEQLIKSIKWEQLIQTNKLHFGKNKAYSNADYFEALLYEIYHLNGYIKTKAFMLKLFELNQPSYIFETSSDFEDERLFYERFVKNIPKEMNYIIPPLKYVNYLNDESINKQFQELIGKYVVNFAYFFKWEVAVINDDIEQIKNLKMQNDIYLPFTNILDKNEKEWFYRYLYNVSQCKFSNFKNTLMEMNESCNEQYWNSIKKDN